MRWACLFLALVAAALAVVFLRGWTAEARARSRADRPESGMALLADYRCRPGETRRVVVRGVEDRFSPAGDEAAGPHPRLVELDYESEPRQVGYDAATPDAGLSDFFPVPPSVVSAIFVTRLRPIAENSNDAIWLGDNATGEQGVPASRQRRFAGILPELESRHGWKRNGDLYWTDLATVRLGTHETLLAHLQSPASPGVVDLNIGDDTAVDFAAMAWCERPPSGKGVTLAHVPQIRDRTGSAVNFDCRDPRPGGLRCDPITGDTPCEERRPLLCYRERNSAAPMALHPFQAEGLPRSWTGGDLAATEPVRASRFRTIGEADGFCAARFGPGWRVAEWHDGGRGWSLGGTGQRRSFSGRYWIDVRGAPYGTCWRRNHG